MKIDSVKGKHHYVFWASYVNSRTLTAMYTDVMIYFKSEEKITNIATLERAVKNMQDAEKRKIETMYMDENSGDIYIRLNRRRKDMHIGIDDIHVNISNFKYIGFDDKD